jgi:hypothetical protein
MSEPTMAETRILRHWRTCFAPSNVAWSYRPNFTIEEREDRARLFLSMCGTTSVASFEVGLADVQAMILMLTQARDRMEALGALGGLTQITGA